MFASARHPILSGCLQSNPVQRHIFGFQIFIQPVFRAFAAETGLLDPAEGGGGVGDDAGVHAHHAVSDGTVNMEMINRATAAATLQFGRLDDATLDKLNAAVAAARDKMAALKDEAADTVAQLQTELARLRGDGEQARRLEEERKLRELNVKLSEAEAQGNSEAAARYRQAVSLQRQIYRERAEQEEQAEKARAENPQAGLAAAFEAAPPQIGIPLSDLQRLIEARDKRVAEAAAESVIAGLEAAFRRTV